MMAALSLSNLTAWLVQVGVIATLGAVLPMMFRIRHPRTQLIYCDAVLILALLLPSIQPWHHPVLITATKPPAAAAGTVSAPQATGSASQPQRIAAPERVILWILAMGAAVKLGWLGSGLWRLRRYRAGATPLYPSPPSIWSARKITGTDALFCLSSSVSSPVTFGFVQPIVLVPRSFLELDTDAQVGVACHELLHIRRNDWIVTIFEELAGAILWFQPGVWWLLSQTRLAREEAVDAEVVRLTSACEPYINALLIMAGESAGLDLAPAPLFLRRRHLTARMHFLLAEASMSRMRLISSYVLMLAILCGAGWLALDAFPLVGPAQIRKSKQLSDNITISPGGDLIDWNILYPADALAKRVEGTVWVELTLRANGDVGDARIMSGPDELRRSVLQ